MLRVTVQGDDAQGRAVITRGYSAAELIDAFLGACTAAGWGRETVIDAMAEAVAVEERARESAAEDDL